ncbi:MAG: hypothetical protein ACQEQ0_08680 [Bacteroidota bacterium]
MYLDEINKSTGEISSGQQYDLLKMTPTAIEKDMHKSGSSALDFLFAIKVLQNEIKKLDFSHQETTGENRVIYLTRKTELKNAIRLLQGKHKKSS